MARQSKLNELARSEGREVREILTEMYLKYGKQKAVAQALGVAPSTLSTTIAKLGGREVSRVVFPEEQTS